MLKMLLDVFTFIENKNAFNKGRAFGRGSFNTVCILSFHP